jgi:hypothetical protein
MESIEISSVSNSNDAVELSSDVFFIDSTVAYESGEYHCNDGTDFPSTWTCEHGPPTPEESTNDENEHLSHEKMILDALQVEGAGEVTMEYCIICYQDYKVGELIAWSSNSPCHNKFHQQCILQWLMSNVLVLCCCIPLIHWHK